MAALNDCCPPCPQPPVNIPGAAGAPGTDGTNGVNAFSTIASFQGIGFTVPAVGSSATVYLVDTGEWMAVGQQVYVQSAGQYQVTGAASTNANGTFVQLQNLGTPGNAVPGSFISAGLTISPSGLAGSNAYTVTTEVFDIPAIGYASAITCQNVAWMVPGQVVFVQGAGYFQVQSINVSNGTAFLFNQGYAGTATSGEVFPGSGVGPAGPQGSFPSTNPPTPFYLTGQSINLTNSMVNVGTAQIILPSSGTWIVCARLVVNHHNTNLNVNDQPQYSAQIEAQAAGTGPFSALPDSVTSPYMSTSVASGIANCSICQLPLTVYETTTVGDVLGLFAEYILNPATNPMQVTEIYLMAFCISL